MRLKSLKLERSWKSTISILQQDFTTSNRLIQPTSFLLDFTDRMSMHKAICVADLMSAGRGRRMRPWFGGAFENIMMSIAWKFPKKRQLPGLSLAIAVIVARSLKSELGIEVQMKWPNDILWNNQKLGGILVEIVESVAVVGIGLNGRISDKVKEEIGQPVISIYDIIGSTVNRAQLIEALALSLNSGLQQFQEHGFQPFRQYWARPPCFVRLLGSDR